MSKKGREGVLTNIAGDVAVQPAKHHVAVAKLGRPALAHHHVRHGGAHGAGLLPPRRVPVPLPGGARRGADGVEDERRVVLEEHHEALADGARAAQHACRTLSAWDQP